MYVQLPLTIIRGILSLIISHDCPARVRCFHRRLERPTSSLQVAFGVTPTDCYNALPRTGSLAEKPCDLFTDILTGLALHSIQGDSTVGPGSNFNEPQSRALIVSVLSTVVDSCVQHGRKMNQEGYSRQEEASSMIALRYDVSAFRHSFVFETPVPPTAWHQVAYRLYCNVQCRTRQAYLS